MTDIERLLAIEEIKNTKARYFRCMDTKDWEGFAAVFAPDATVDYAPDDKTSERFKAAGANKVVALVRSIVERAVTIHHGHMAEVELISENSARAIFAMEDLVYWPPENPSTLMHGWGHYHETYERRIDRAGGAMPTVRQAEHSAAEQASPRAAFEKEFARQGINDRWLIKTLVLTRLRVENTPRTPPSS